MDRDLVAELPFTLMHPKPEEDLDNARPCSSDAVTAAAETSGSVQGAEGSTAQDPAIDTNLIQLDTLVYCTSSDYLYSSGDSRVSVEMTNGI